MVRFMKINTEVKNEIMMNNLLGEHRKSYNILFKLYNNKLENVFDKWYVLYNIALVSKKLNNIKMAKMYVTECQECMMNTVGYDTEKGKLEWLDLELNKDNLTKEQIIEKYELINNYFYYLKEFDFEKLGIKSSVLLLKRDYDGLENIINICYSLGHHNERYIEVIQNIMLDLQQNDQYGYNKMINIFKEYKLA